MTIGFIGHSDVTLSDKLKELVREHLKNSILNNDSVTVYLGGT